MTGMKLYRVVFLSWRSFLRFVIIVIVTVLLISVAIWKRTVLLQTNIYTTNSRDITEIKALPLVSNSLSTMLPNTTSFLKTLVSTMPVTKTILHPPTSAKATLVTTSIPKTTVRSTTAPKTKLLADSIPTSPLYIGTSSKNVLVHTASASETNSPKLISFPNTSLETPAAKAVLHTTSVPGVMLPTMSTTPKVQSHMTLIPEATLHTTPAPGMHTTSVLSTTRTTSVTTSVPGTMLHTTSVSSGMLPASSSIKYLIHTTSSQPIQNSSRLPTTNNTHGVTTSLRRIDTTVGRPQTSALIVPPTTHTQRLDTQSTAALDDAKYMEVKEYFKPRITTAEMGMFRGLMKIFHDTLYPNVTYFLYGGTLLGSYRNHDMIPWDDDLDLFVDETNKPILEKRLEALGSVYTLNKQVKYSWKFTYTNSTLTRYGWNWPFLDIFFYTSNASSIWDNHPQLRTHKYPKSDIFPLKMRPFMGMLIPSPKKHVIALKYLFDLDVCVSPTYNHKTESAIGSSKQIQCAVLKAHYPFVKREITENKTFEILVANGHISVFDPQEERYLYF